MKNEPIICDYCKKVVPEQIKSHEPTWFGRYFGEQRIGAICKDCLIKNREHWKNWKNNKDYKKGKK